MTDAGRTPRIIAFLCRWCSYEGADAAGRARLEVPAGVRTIRVPCSGRVDPALVVEAFVAGADGVAVLGCHAADCHYRTGAVRAEHRMALLGALLAPMGIAPERLLFDHVSATESKRFQHLMTTLAARLAELGPPRTEEAHP